MSDARREAQSAGGKKSSCNLWPTARTLHYREAWKYALLSDKLLNDSRKFEFEFPIDSSVFDLALHDKRMLVEFDGSYHRNSTQIKIDVKKDDLAKKYGYTLVRIKVANNTVINPSVIEGL
jgi:very-short-patch-repair endonuclease